MTGAIVSGGPLVTRAFSFFFCVLHCSFMLERQQLFCDTGFGKRLQRLGWLVPQSDRFLVPEIVVSGDVRLIRTFSSLSPVFFLRVGAEHASIPGSVVFPQKGFLRSLQSVHSTHHARLPCPPTLQSTYHARPACLILDVCSASGEGDDMGMGPWGRSQRAAAATGACPTSRSTS